MLFLSLSLSHWLSVPIKEERESIGIKVNIMLRMSNVRMRFNLFTFFFIEQLSAMFVAWKLSFKS